MPHRACFENRILHGRLFAGEPKNSDRIFKQTSGAMRRRKRAKRTRRPIPSYSADSSSTELRRRKLKDNRVGIAAMFDESMKPVIVTVNASSIRRTSRSEE